AGVFASLALACYGYAVAASGNGAQLSGIAPGLGWPVASALLWIASARLLAAARRALERYAPARVRCTIVLAAAAAVAALGPSMHLQASTGLDPTEHAHAAIAYALLAYQGLFVALAAIMAAYLVARSRARRL